MAGTSPAMTSYNAQACTWEPAPVLRAGGNAMATDAEMLKLAALDAEDLSVLSAHLQDAVAKVVDMAFLQKEKRFAMLVNRFDWAASERGNPMRRRAGVQLERVLGAQTRGFSLADRNTILNLLAVEFEETDKPSGTGTLFFSGDAAIRLQVECLEAEISD